MFRASLKNGQIHFIAIAVHGDREIRLQIFRGDLIFPNKLAHDLLADFLFFGLLDGLAGNQVGHHPLGQQRRRSVLTTLSVDFPVLLIGLGDVNKQGE